MTLELIGGPADGHCFNYTGDVPDYLQIPTWQPTTQSAAMIIFGYPTTVTYNLVTVIDGLAKYEWSELK